jgi:adenylosuccinate lyase
MNELNSLFALSPLDGRYGKQLNELSRFFSESALIKYRLRVESLYLIRLLEFIKPELEIEESKKDKILNLWQTLTEQELIKIKKIEEKINHDTKAVEYYFKGYLFNLELEELTEWIHFGLTSEDVNNLAYALMLKEAMQEVIRPAIARLIDKLRLMTEKYAEIPMLARTHGQPASPTTLGKELAVFLNRVFDETETMGKIKPKGKINGATGNYNAFYAAFPDKDWLKFSSQLISEFGLEQNLLTTQIEPHDKFAELFDSISRLNNIITDLNVDLWHYISLNYFSLEKKAEEIGSSTMPHKVNPIDFENSEGNLGLANSMLEFMKNKLTKSRLQRDLSDSTVLRNIGVALGYTLLAYKSTLKGLNKLKPEINILKEDLENHVEILAEGIQTILRAEGVEKPYELLKELTRGNKITLADLHKWIDDLEVSEEIKVRLKALRVSDYIGIAVDLAKITAKKAKKFLL